MTQLYGSYNSRYFAVRTPGAVDVFKGDSHFIRHQVDDAAAGDLLRLGNNGDLFFRGPRGVFLLRGQRGARPEPVQAVAHLLAPESPARLGGLVVNVDGREFCYEQISPENRLSSKLFRLLGTKQEPGQPSATSHKLFLCNMATGQLLEVFTAYVDVRRAGTFRWAISPAFFNLVVAEVDRKGGLHFQVIDIIDEAITSEFDLKLSDVTALSVNDRGTVMLELRRAGSDKLVLWTANQERCVVNIPPHARVFHFGFEHIVFVIPSGPYLVVKRYDDTVLQKIDLRPLSSFDLDYMLNFNERQDIDIVTFRDKNLKVQHTDLQTLPTDAKRWKMLADQKRLHDEEAMVSDAVKAQEAEKKRLEGLEKSRRLAQSVQPAPPSIAPSSAPVISSSPAAPPRLPFNSMEQPAPPRHLPSQLPLETSRPQIRSHPSELPLEIPESRLPAPESIPFDPPESPRESPAELPFEPSAGRAESGSTEPPVRPPTAADLMRRMSMADQAPGGHPAAPEPEPELELTLGPEPEPEPELELELEFASGEEPAASPAAEVAPLAEPSAPSQRTAAEIDEELERLRMHYIAGEIGRDDYYRRKRELEEERSQAAVTAEPAAPAEITPDRLSLDIEPGPTSPAPARQRARSLPLMQGRRIELGSDSESGGG